MFALSWGNDAKNMLIQPFNHQLLILPGKVFDHGVFFSQVLLPMANQNTIVFGLQGQRIDSDVRKYHENTMNIPQQTLFQTRLHGLQLFIYTHSIYCFHLSKVQRKTYPLCCREYNTYDWITHFGWIKQCKCES